MLCSVIEHGDDAISFSNCTKIHLFVVSCSTIMVFSSGGGGGGRNPHELYVPLITAVSPLKSKNCPPPISVDHGKNFFRYFFNLCMTKANLTSITSLRMQTLLSYWNIKRTTIEINKVGSMRLQLHVYRPILLYWCCVIVRIWER